MKRLLILLLLCYSPILLAQKRALEPSDFDTWKRISGQKISQDGSLVLYHTIPGKGDQQISITTTKGKGLITVPRAENGEFTWDNEYAVFKIKPALDSVNHLRRIKTKKEKMPKDSLGIYSVKSGSLEKIHGIRKFAVPPKWDGYIFYQLDTPLPEEKKEEEEAESDTTKTKEAPKPAKKMSEDNGFHLIVYNTTSNTRDTIKYVTDFRLAEEQPYILYHTTGKDSTELPGVYHMGVESGTITPMTRHEKGKFERMSINRTGDVVAFLTDLDTTKALVRNYELRVWKSGGDSARVVAAQNTNTLPGDWLVSKHSNLRFSEDNQRLFFGTTPVPPVQDTTLLKEEIVQVEIWNYTNGRLHTQQNAELEDDKKKNYLAMLDLTTGQIQQLANEQISDIQLDQDRVSPVAVGFDYNPYYKYVSWQGMLRRDVYKVDMATGNKHLIKKDLHGYADVSPLGKFITWYSMTDTTWFVYNNATAQEVRIDIGQSFANERNDVPNYPWAYGSAGWTKGDEALLLYDRYDIWKIDPVSGGATRITEGREVKTSYRYVDLDYEKEAINTDFMLLSTFDETTKDEGFVQMKKLKSVKPLMSGSFSYSRPVKAYNSDALIYTKESQAVFPDLLASDLSFKESTRLSDANPEIANYYWGTVEMHQWTSLDGVQLEGLLYKPEGFDATKKYPMITYFYERNSDNLHRHWGARPIRSIVNPSYYASRGYLVFIPDIVYTTGYPGKSCYDAVVPGVNSLIDLGFVDKDNLGVQGHSWGGYQVAYLVTQTDMFQAAEAGAVVSNMISAYGGIRWWTGLSRMFQYERTQSRLGATLWEKPDLYIENSPIFMVDKINTPLLLMHNDADGHVPWYQGIEFFVALRRLNKPAWMLNYNGEPHWPTKYENIIDFNIRMQQFFDHYLMDAPLPRWMSEDGIPAIEKGINNGLELIGEE